MRFELICRFRPDMTWGQKRDACEAFSREAPGAYALASRGGSDLFTPFRPTPPHDADVDGVTVRCVGGGHLSHQVWHLAGADGYDYYVKRDERANG